MGKPKKKSKRKGKNYLGKNVISQLSALDRLTIDSDNGRAVKGRNKSKAVFNGQRYTRFDNPDRNLHYNPQQQQPSPPYRGVQNPANVAPAPHPAPQPLMAMQQNLISSNKRFIVIDGSNVAVT